MNRVILALAVFLVVAAMPVAGARGQSTDGLSKAEIQGRQLTQEIVQERPVTNITQTAVLTVRNAGGTTSIPVTINTFVSSGHWMANYTTTPISNSFASIELRVVHRDGQPNIYLLFKPREIPQIVDPDAAGPTPALKGDQIWAPFADSDFWIADLGLEFFHWPDQKILRHEDKRTRACAVLESTNPNPAPGAYSRVVSWIDNETLGPVHAEAYDNDGKLLKVFDPKTFKKVNGQWQLQDMEIRNVQTKSRSVIKFDLNSK